MRILQVSHNDRGGGAALTARSLFEEYRARGHTSWMAVGQRSLDDPDVFVIPNQERRNAWARAWRRADSALDHAASLKGGHRVTRAWRELTPIVAEPWRFAESWFGREDFDYPGTKWLLDLPPATPDVVHCQNLHGYYFDLRLLPQLSSRVPVVLTLHDAWLLTGHCAHPRACSRWEDGCGECPDLKTYPAVRRDATAFNWSRKRRIYARSRLYVTAPSAWLIELARQSILDAADYRVVPNAIDLRAFRPASRKKARELLRIEQDEIVVVFPAHNPYKDRLTIEEALRHVDTRGKPARWIALGGSGPSRRLGSGILHEIPFLDDPHEVALRYVAADLYLHAATAEAFGLSLAEALACGTACIATDVGGIPEVVEDGVSGLLVPARDAGALAAMANELLRDPAKRAALGAKAVEQARRFSLQRQADLFIELYSDVISDWREWHDGAEC